MTLQHQWGSVGMALALTTIVGVCGAGVAQTAISTNPPPVNDLTSPTPRAQVNDPAQAPAALQIQPVTVDEDMPWAWTNDDGNAREAYRFDLKAGVTLTIGKSYTTRTLIFACGEGSDVNPPTVTVAEGVSLTCPLRFQNAAGATGGTIRFSVPASATGWQPASLTMDCDLTLASTLPAVTGGWPITVPAHRTLRLTAENAAEDSLPAVTLANTTATLALADDSVTANFFPAKYQGFLQDCPGILAFERDVTLGGIAPGEGRVNLAVADRATLTFTGNAALYPFGQRGLTVHNGSSVVGDAQNTVSLTFEAPTSTQEGIDLQVAAPHPGLVVDGEVTLEDLTIDALTGDGVVTPEGTLSIGTVAVAAGDEIRFREIGLPPTLSIGAIAGEGTLFFGTANTTLSLQAIVEAILAGGFSGTVAFSNGNAAFATLDLAAANARPLPCTIRAQPSQKIIMRLDQYAETPIIWPDSASSQVEQLTLIEAGPFGGEATVPAWPDGTTVIYGRYDADGSVIADGSFSPTLSKNPGGQTIDLTWDDPKLDGKVAWVDIEFNDTSLNTGWATLTGPNGETGSPDRHNGMLRGDDNSDEVFTSGYADAWNPVGRGAEIDRRPYISVKSIEYPEEWTLVTRLRMPEYSDMSVLTIGANYVDTTGGTDADYSGYAVLALATGALQDRGTHVGHLDDNASDVLNLWFFPENTCADDWRPLTSVSVPNLTDSFHLLTIRYDHGRVALFMDEHQVLDVMLPAGTKLGPGLQFGSLMGGANVDPSLRGKFRWMDDVTGLEPGTIDFLRLYDGLLPNSAITELAAAYPYVHKERGTTYVRDVRYVRRERRGNNWVSEKAWVRQTTSDGNWTPYMSSVEAAPDVWDSDLYDEPAEGSIVLVECDGATTLSVNTTKHDVFPSENRTYAQLIVTGSGTLTLEPCEGWETPNEDGSYAYGRLVFSGGQGDKAAQHEGASDEKNGGGTDAAYFYADANIRASVCDLSRDGISLKDNNTVAIYADEGLMRGEEDALHAVKHLTGPVSGTGTFTKSTSVNTKYGQKSDYVLVDYFDPDDATWLISDVTVANNGSITESPRMDTGLFAEFTKIPGILYLELAQDALDGAEGSLSEQKWHRFGYNGDDASETDSGLAPEPALPQDFARADGLCIRLKEGTADTLRVDSAGAVTLPFLVVEAPKNDDVNTESLAILPSTGGDQRITFSEAVATARPLTVYDAAAAGGVGADGIGVMPREVTLPDTTGDTVIFIQGGTRLYGEGPYRAGKTTFAYDLDGSTIATLESLGELIFSAEQSLPKTDLVATPGASIVQAGTDAPFAVKSLTLQGEGSTFRFNSTAVDVAESLLLATDAVLDCTQLIEGAAPSVRDVVTDDETGANIDVLLPGNAQDGLIFLQSEEPDFNWIARARLLASSTANLQITRWDVRLDHEGIDGTNYRIATPNLDVPNFDDRPEDIPEEDRPGEGENEWPEGSEDEIVEDIIIDGHIAGEAEGYTMANTKWLMAPDIANAYACFGDVWTLAPRSVDQQSEDYATRDLLMAYEFGISRMAFSQDNAYIVIEATLRNALKDCPYFDPTLLQGADKQPVFLPGVKVAIVGKDGNPLADVQEITAEQAATYGFTPNVSANETSRWFLVPYDDTTFPEGTATNLTVRAIPAAEETPAAE